MANLVYTARGTPIVFQDSGGDAVITLNGLAADAKRISARYDMGSGSKPTLFEIRATYQMNTGGEIGEDLRVWIAPSDGTRPDGEEGTTDAALSSDNKLANMQLALSVPVDTVSTATNITGSGVVFIASRYFQVCVAAPESDALQASANVSHVTLTPIPSEVQ